MKVIEDKGAVAAASKPLRLRRYDAQHLPDPGECVDALIAVNDRSRPGPASLRYSDGSTWLECTGVVVQQTVTAPPVPQIVDVTPLVRDAVRDMLPALMPPAPMVQISASPVEAKPAADTNDLRAIAQAHLAIAELVNELQRRLAEAESRIEYLERTAVASVRGYIDRGAA